MKTRGLELLFCALVAPALSQAQQRFSIPANFTVKIFLNHDEILGLQENADKKTSFVRYSPSSHKSEEILADISPRARDFRLSRDRSLLAFVQSASVGTALKVLNLSTKKLSSLPEISAYADFFWANSCKLGVLRNENGGKISIVSAKSVSGDAKSTDCESKIIPSAAIAPVGQSPVLLRVDESTRPVAFYFENGASISARKLSEGAVFNFQAAQYPYIWFQALSSDQNQANEIFAFDLRQLSVSGKGHSIKLKALAVGDMFSANPKGSGALVLNQGILKRVSPGERKDMDLKEGVKAFFRSESDSSEILMQLESKSGENSWLRQNFVEN